MMKQRIIIGFLCICLASMAFAQERIRIEHGPYLQNLKETETTIVWMASKPSVGWVELAPDDGSTYYQKEREKFFDTTNGVKNTSLLHVVKISGLKPGTGYRYRILSTLCNIQYIRSIEGRLNMVRSCRGPFYYL